MAGEDFMGAEAAAVVAGIDSDGSVGSWSIVNFRKVERTLCGERS